MNSLITFNMVIREMQRLARNLSIRNDFDLHVYVNESQTLFMVENNGQWEKLSIRTDQLLMSLDDYAEFILMPFLYKFMSPDHKFIHQEYT